MREPTGGQWYLHLFAPEQPDLNWDNPSVREEFEDILRFWFDRGVDGIRIDSRRAVRRRTGLPDFDHGPARASRAPGRGPHWDATRCTTSTGAGARIADSYDAPRAAHRRDRGCADTERFAAYLRPDEMHTALQLRLPRLPVGRAKPLRRASTRRLASHAPVGAPATWVLSNHDVTRHVTRYGRADTGVEHARRPDTAAPPADEALGLRRARAAALLTLALPGSVYVYQGEELGLPEVEDLPDEARQDPMYDRSGGTDPGRDGCRVPLPWSGGRPPFGFTAEGGAPWLPQPRLGDLTVEAQQGDPARCCGSTGPRCSRRREAGLGDGPMTWLDSPEEVLAFDPARRSAAW